MSTYHTNLVLKYDLYQEVPTIISCTLINIIIAISLVLLVGSLYPILYVILRINCGLAFTLLYMDLPSGNWVTGSYHDCVLSIAN